MDSSLAPGGERGYRERRASRTASSGRVGDFTHGVRSADLDGETSSRRVRRRHGRPGRPPSPGAGTPCPTGQWRFALSWRTADSTGVTLTNDSSAWTATGGPLGATQGCALTPGAVWTLTVMGPGGTTTVTG